MLEMLADENWLAWGIGLLIGFPLLMVLFGEMLYRMSGESNSRHSFVTNAQYFVLPSLVIYLLLSQVLQLTHENLIIKIVASVFWISILYLSISTFNIFWASKSVDENTWQSRVPNLILNIARLFFILLGIAFVISTLWGVNLGQMLAALGVGSIVLGLALQDTLGGLFAGITLISARQFQIGDWLKSNDVTGQVISINWHSVTLKTLEEDLLVIPNSVLASNIFYNYSRPNRLHMQRISIKFSDDNPPNLVRKALTEAALNTPGVLDDPAPIIRLASLEDEGDYEALLYYNDYGIVDKLTDDYLSYAWYAAERNGVIFPYDESLNYVARTKEFHFGETETISNHELIPKLKDLSAFMLDQNQLEQITVGSQIKRYGKGEIIVDFGIYTHEFLVILEGQAIKQMKDTQGTVRSLGYASKGEVLSVISTVRQEESQIRAIANEDCQIAVLAESSINRILDQNPSFAQKIELGIETRLKTMNAIRRQFASKTQLDENPTEDQQKVTLKDLLIESNSEQKRGIDSEISHNKEAKK